RLESDRALEKAIGGVSVFQGLVDPALVSWVHDHNMQLIAWTVNEDPDFNNLVRLGVDGITTDNLAILKALPSLAAAKQHHATESVRAPAPRVPPARLAALKRLVARSHPGLAPIMFRWDRQPTKCCHPTRITT